MGDMVYLNQGGDSQNCWDWQQRQRLLTVGAMKATEVKERKREEMRHSCQHTSWFLCGGKPGSAWLCELGFFDSMVGRTQTNTSRPWLLTDTQ